MDTHQITDFDCVGDALGKINQNFLMLDNFFCKLSSIFYEGEDCFSITFTDFSEITGRLQNASSIFSQINLFRDAFTTVKILSSFWNAPEINIEYPVNFTKDETNNILSFFVDGVKDVELIEIAKKHLTQTTPLSSVGEGSKMVVNFIIFTSDGSIKDTIIEGTSQNKYPRSKYWHIDLQKNDVSLKRNRRFVFQKFRDNWIYLTTL